MPTVIDVLEKFVGRKATALKLIGVKTRPGQIIWLRYRAS